MCKSVPWRLADFGQVANGLRWGMTYLGTEIGNTSFMNLTLPSLRSTSAWLLASFLLLGSNAWAQRSSSKSTKIDVVTVPTVPEAMVNRVAFFVHADPGFFTLDDLRRYGGNIKIIKEGERLENMKYFSLGREVEIVDDMPTCVVDVALGPETYPEPRIASETKKNSDAKTYWAEITHDLPVRVTISDGEGNVMDGFEITSTNQIRYGNEKISTMETGPLGGFSYTQGFLSFDSPVEVREKLRSFEGQRFVRRKAVLMQLSKVIDEMEDRLFFLETKQDVNIYVGKGKHDYEPLEVAQDQALDAFKAGDFDALSAPMAVWTEWATEVDFVDKKAKVTKKVATGLHLNLAVCHLYRDEFVECAQAISAARGLAVGQDDDLAVCDDLLNRLMKRRRASTANPDFVLPTEDEVKREKAPDFKNTIGKRSENKDVAMILGGDRYLEMGGILARWKAEFVAGSAEASAAEAAEMSMDQRLGMKLTSALGGVALSLNPLTDPDLVGQSLPVEVLTIPKLVSLDLSGMKMGSLPDNIDQLSMLQTLIVSGNQLETLPATLANIPTLKRIVARNNNLTAVPEGLETLPELKTLDLKGNPFDDGGKVQTTRRFGEDVKLKFD